MRILYHHRTLGDGAEGIHITEMIRAFESLGFTVTARVPGGASGRPGVLPRLIKRTFPKSLFELVAAGHSLFERRQLRRLLKELQPSFLYARHALNDVGVLEAARDTQTPSVLEVNAVYSSDSHDRFEPLRFRRIARTLEARAFRLADVVVPVSSPLEMLVRDLAPMARTLVVPNGADPQQFRPDISGGAVRKRFGFPDGSIVVGWSGVLRSWHGLDVLLRALVSQPLFTLLVIGDGPERTRTEEQAAMLGVGDRLRVSGFVSRHDMPEYLAAIDVGVVADDRTRYASPMKLLEYMAMGKPVVAPDLPNIRDILTAGREGLLFAAGQPDALASCFELLKDAAVRARLGRMAREHVVKERNWLANARCVLDAVSRETSNARMP